jgi:hypothetical protein
VYITALFAFFNRVADAFGLPDPGYRSMATPQIATTETTTNGPMQAPPNPQPASTPPASPPAA